MVGKVSAFVLGNGPPLMPNVWYSPGLIPPPASAVQWISVTASRTDEPCTSTGGSMGPRVSVAVQPGTGLVLTEASGVVAGICTRTEIVEAVSLSLGTRNCSSP